MVYPKEISEFAKTREGSKVLQNDLKNPNPTLIAYMVKEIDTKISDIMVDVYGNYYC